MYFYAKYGESSLGFKFERNQALEFPIATAIARMIRLGSDMDTVYSCTDTDASPALLRQTDLFDLIVSGISVRSPPTRVRNIRKAKTRSDRRYRGDGHIL